MPPISVPQIPKLQVQPFAVLGGVKTAPDGSAHADAPRVRTLTEIVPGQTDTNPPLASPQERGENTSPSIPSKPQPKRARRTKLSLSEELVARDLDWFKSNQVSVVNEDSSKATLSPSVPTSDTAQIPQRSPTPKKKTARMVPSRRFPRRVSLDAAQHVDGQQSSLETAESDARSATMQTAEIWPHGELPSPGPEPPLATASSNEPPTILEIPQTAHQSPSVRAPMLNGGSPRPLPETMPENMESMDISTSDSGSEGMSSGPYRRTKSSPPPSPQAFQLRGPLLPPLVGDWDPSLNLNFNFSQLLSVQLQNDANQQRFDGEMTVIHSTHGKPFTHTHTIDLGLNESIFAKISKWVNRRSNPSYVASFSSLEPA